MKVGLHCAERMRYLKTRTGMMGLALLLMELAIAAVHWLVLGADQPFFQVSFYEQCGQHADNTARVAK